MTIAVEEQSTDEEDKYRVRDVQIWVLLQLDQQLINEHIDIVALADKASLNQANVLMGAGLRWKP